MARYVKSGTVNTVQEINSELEKIATAMAEALARDGATPNEMSATLDMNSNRIINLPSPTDANSPLRLADRDLITASLSDAEVITNVTVLIATNLQVGDYAITKGYSSVADGGGAEYQIVAGGTGTADGGSFIDLNNGNQAQLISGGALNVKQFGAVGDGVANDTTSWDAWIAAGGDFIPTGSYLVSGVVKKYTVPTFVVTTLNNHASGFQAFETNTTGYNNVAIGYNSLKLNDVGYDNVAVGIQAMKDNTTGNRNTAVGVDALAKNTVGDHNLALGQNALGFNTVGTYNTALGIDALEFGLDNNFNTAIGQYAGLNLDNSSNNTVVGYNTYQAATSGNSNVTLGKDTLRDQNGVDANTAIGTEALRENTTGAFLTAVGYRAGRTNTTGTHLTLIGDQAGFKNTSGTHNIAMGFTASYENLVGTYNIGIGDSALFSNTGSNNVAIGGFAGYNITTGTQNTFIGHSSGFNAGQKVDAVNTTAVGRNAFTTKDNTVQLGNPSVVGIGVGANKIEFLAAVPSTGAWERGDVVYNLSVVAGGSMGWMCVTAGDFAGAAPVFKAMPSVAV